MLKNSGESGDAIGAGSFFSFFFFKAVFATFWWPDIAKKTCAADDFGPYDGKESCETCRR